MKTLLPLQAASLPASDDPQPLVIYHGRNCPDGFAAALAAWIYYGAQAEFLGLDHGDVKTLADLPALAGRAVYILDFSFAAELLHAIAEQAAKLVLLDHHQSAAEKLSGFVCRCGELHFDRSKSGARMAWEFFLPQRPLPALVRFIEDRDIWVWQYPESPAFLAALDMEPFAFARWEQLAALDASGLQAFMARGQAMDEKFNKLARDLLDNAVALRFNGIDGVMLNAPSAFHSVLGDWLTQQGARFALLWTVGKGAVVKAGLRSQPGFDCIALAESMGGGGHAQACGFKMPAQRLPELLSGVFNA